ncbi:5-(carboxyamino)imidazole ribonucleotide synthase [Mollicutes bacterium LVI A0039]|nr:5-(carboxyamino)imidazole ribonucleotide synthase [Mollicutes bacterium LVI A0039]
MQIGIIGGGQLAMMLCEAASKLGYSTIVLDPNPNCSAKQFCNQLICSAYDDLSGLEQLAQTADVVTYEFENVSVAGIDHIQKLYGNVVQTSKPLILSNDRLIEKQAALESGFAPAPFAPVSSVNEVRDFASNVGYPIVLKTRKFGYDGKGQVVIKSEQELECDAAREIISSGAIAEQMIDLEFETSVIAIRSASGECQFIPSTINTHVNNILSTSQTLTDNLDPHIYELVTKYLDYHNLIGIITVEVFISRDGTVYFNEIAPRPHNSGHYSIEGCNHSQFEMHLLAITDQPLPEVKLLDQTLMVNVLGQDYQSAKDFVNNNLSPNIHFHDYFKEAAITNRKMAHITAVGASAIGLLKNYQAKENNE